MCHNHYHRFRKSTNYLLCDFMAEHIFNSLTVVLLLSEEALRQVMPIPLGLFRVTQGKSQCKMKLWLLCPVKKISNALYLAHFCVSLSIFIHVGRGCQNLDREGTEGRVKKSR